MVILDLDRLKKINDERGHAAGDAYIKAAGHALRTAVRPADPVARLGGDEFGILLTRCTEASAEARVAQLSAALVQADVDGSIGWAPISVLAGFPAAQHAADEAMYAAKRRRRTGDVAA